MTTAVELLRKGGTLAGEPCSSCSGVQVKFGEKIICVSCGKEEIVKTPEAAKPEATVDVFGDLKNLVTSKIGELLPNLRSEKDLEKQSNLAELVKIYLEIIEKIPKDDRSGQ
jgi:uncharacterized Zn finger protein (UPF0148 family)